MQYTLNKGTQSNYEIALTVTPDEMAANKEKALNQFQKDMEVKGFRKWEVPLDMVEKNVQPTYLQLALYEESVHQGTMQVVKEHEEIKFIGNIYDLQQEDKEGTITFTYKLDIYPEVETKDSKWEKTKIDAIDDAPTEDEINDTLANLQKQYADYQPHDTVEWDTICKVAFQILNESGAEIDRWSLYVGKEEFEEFEMMRDTFGGKKEWEEVQFDYTDSMPPMLQLRKTDTEGTPTHIKATISDIRKVSLPEWTEENIKKFFGNEELKTLDELKNKVTEAIKSQKKEALLMQWVEKYLWEISPSFGSIIPKTLIDEEMKSRTKSLAERMWWEEWLKNTMNKYEKKNKLRWQERLRRQQKAHFKNSSYSERWLRRLV